MFILSVEWGSVADWVSGIGTFAAVIVSLYLANHRKRPRIIFEPKIYDGNWYIIVYNPDYEPVFLNFTGDINTETKNKTIYLESLAKTETYQYMCLSRIIGVLGEKEYMSIFMKNLIIESRE